MIEGCLEEAKDYVEWVSIKWQGGVLLEPEIYDNMGL